MYTWLRDDMVKHIDKLDGIIVQLRAMGSSFDELLAIGILFVLIDVLELNPVTSIKTPEDKNVNW